MLMITRRYVDLNSIVTDASTRESSVKWKGDAISLSGNTPACLLFTKMKNKLLYPKSSMDAVELEL